MGVAEPLWLYDAFAKPECIVCGGMLDGCAYGRTHDLEPTRVYSRTYRLSLAILSKADAWCVQGARYGIDNEGLIGLCFLPSGVGEMRELHDTPFTHLH